MADLETHLALLAAADNSAKKMPAAPAAQAVMGCLPVCEAHWKTVDDETNAVSSINEPLERNRKISAAYADLNLRPPDLKWIGLAAVVSRQAGCAMNEADAGAQSWLPVVANSAKTAKDALAETNKLIFSDIYPVMRFYEKFGAAELKRCADCRGEGKEVRPAMLKAIETIDQGNVRLGSNSIAEYEQRSIVEAQIYSQPKYREVFAANEKAYKYFYGRPFGAKATEMALSAACGAGEPVPFIGSISSPDDRIAYYTALMNAYEKRSASGQQELMRAISAQGR